MELDPQQFALGNNLLGSQAKNATSRIAIYYSNDGGRLLNSTTLLDGANDPGKLQQ